VIPGFTLLKSMGLSLEGFEKQTIPGRELESVHIKLCTREKVKKRM
jgi:hypothetical protein